jgi:hypothetical protein
MIYIPNLKINGFVDLAGTVPFPKIVNFMHDPRDWGPCWGQKEQWLNVLTK